MHRPCCCLPQFGGSSVASAERMMEVADIVCSFPEHLPCVVLSAMGKVRGRVLHGWHGMRGLVACAARSQVCWCAGSVNPLEPAPAGHSSCVGPASPRNTCPPALALPCPQTTNLLLQCGEEALRTDASNIRSLAPLK